MRTVVRSARSVIHTKDLNVKFWGEDASYAVFTLNQTWQLHLIQVLVLLSTMLVGLIVNQ